MGKKDNDNNLNFKNELDKINHKLSNLLEYNKRQDKNVAVISEILTGNGDPQKGIVYEIAKAREQRKNIFTTLKLHWGLFVLIIGAIIKVAFFS